MATTAKDTTPSTEVAVLIKTESWIVPKDKHMPPVAPTIKLNGKDFPAPKDGLKAAHGYQVIATDAAKDMTDPASILLNEYHYLPRVNDSYMPYEHMYRQMVHALLSAGDITRQRVFIVSFGMAAHAPPPVDVYEYLIGLGAGSVLQGWETSRRPGEIGAAPNYIGYAANYVLLGDSGSGYGQGVEHYFDFEGAIGHEMTPTLHNPQPAPRKPHPVR